MAEAFKTSPYFAKLQDDIATYKLRHEQADHDDALRKGVKDSTHPLTGARNPYRKNFLQQTIVLVRRQYHLTLADKQTFFSRIVSNILQSTLIGAIRTSLLALLEQTNREIDQSACCSLQAGEGRKWRLRDGRGLVLCYSVSRPTPCFALDVFADCSYLCPQLLRHLLVRRDPCRRQRSPPHDQAPNARLL